MARDFVLSVGRVELENLPLKKDALKSLELAVEVKHGLWLFLVVWETF